MNDRQMALVTIKRINTKRSKVYEGTCQHCGHHFYMDGTQTAMRYCDAACRQAAYRERKRAKELEPLMRILHGANYGS